MAANQTPLRVALGGWYTPALIGLVQMIALFTVVVVAIDIVPAHLPLTLVFLVLCSVTFIAILHMLNAWLGSSGQFLGLVMMVLQLITAGGTFPWQTAHQRRCPQAARVERQADPPRAGPLIRITNGSQTPPLPRQHTCAPKSALCRAPSSSTRHTCVACTAERSRKPMP